MAGAARRSFLCLVISRPHAIPPSALFATTSSTHEEAKRLYAAVRRERHVICATCGRLVPRRDCQVDYDEDGRKVGHVCPDCV